MDKNHLPFLNKSATFNDIENCSTMKEAIEILVQFEVRTRVVLYFSEIHCYQFYSIYAKIKLEDAS